VTPETIIPAWPKERAVDRAESCIVFLAVHGFISDGEKAKVRGRLLKWFDRNAATPAAPMCRHCGRALLSPNIMMADGCPCNSPRGVNHGLVPKNICTCDECDPAQTGSARPTTPAPTEPKP
jgi:hypothetical protein